MLVAAGSTEPARILITGGTYPVRFMGMHPAGNVVVIFNTIALHNPTCEY